jgi:hypothetical protein
MKLGMITELARHGDFQTSNRPGHCEWDNSTASGDYAGQAAEERLSVKVARQSGIWCLNITVPVTLDL